jgi:hypothetical protein
LDVLFAPARTEYSGGLIELRYGHDRKLDHWAYFNLRVEGIAEAAAFAANRNREGNNVYVGVNPRKPATSTKRAASERDVEIAFWHFADLDDAAAVQALPQRIKGMPPTFSVTTGTSPHRRPHLYWQLAEPVGNLPEWSRRQRGIAQCLGGDSVIDAPRIMRLAGTVNYPPQHKIARGYRMELTTIRTEFGDERAPITPEQVTAAYPFDAGRARASQPQAANGERRITQTGELLEACRSDNQWHNSMVRLTAHLASKGRTTAEILALAEHITLPGYSIEQTRDEMQAALNGARIKWDIADPEDPLVDHFDPETGEVLEIGLPDPVDLWARYEPAKLPSGLLPDVIERYALSQAEMMGVDPGGVAMAALAVCSAAITDRICVQVKQHDPTWRESARIWVALIGPPSAKKTPIMGAAARPLNRIDSELFRQYMTQMEAYEEDQSAKKSERLGISKPLQKRLRIGDATVEAAQEVLKGSPDGVLSVQDELSGWFGAMDKYGGAKGSAGDRAFWLQAFNGGQYALNRVARGAALIPNLSISVLGGIQPEPLRRLVGDSVDDGLVQRLIPVPLHRASVGLDAPRSGEMEAYDQLVADLWAMRPYHDSDPMRFSPEAQEIRRDLETRHHDMMSAELISPKMASHFGKYDGIFARLCVLWHAIGSQGMTSPPTVISGATAALVANFLHSFIVPNAIAFYVGMLGLADDHETLVDLAAYIVANRLETVNSRVIQRAGRNLRAQTADECRTLCEKLESMGWLIETDPGQRSNTPRWRVNPIVHTRFAERSVKEQARKAKAKDAIRDALALSKKGADDE